MEDVMTSAPTPEGKENAGKNARIGVRLAAIDKRSIAAKAKLAGLSTGEYMRRAALGRTIVERIPPELRRLLGATSSHLHQLTKLANAGRLPGAGIEQLNDLVVRLLQTLR